MNRLTGLILILAAFGLNTRAQTILNGDFENNTAGFDQINLPNASYNSYMPDNFAFGSYGDMDIISSATYCGLAQSGSWYVALTGGVTDAITMTLSTPLVAGETYTLTFWDRGCIGFSTSSPPVQIGVSDVNNSIGTIVFTAASPVESVWTMRTATFVAPIDGLYISASCPTGGLSDWVQIDNFSFGETLCPLSVDLGPDVTICSGSSVTLDATLAGGTYLWSTGETTPTIDVTSSAIYDVVVTIDDCDYADEIEVSVVSPPVVDLGADQTVCAGDIAVFDATTAGATYLWQDGSVGATYSATVPGTYTCTVSISGCSDTDSAELVTEPVPSVDLGIDQTVCEGETITLDATYPGATYVWQDGSTGATLDVQTTTAASVTVTLGNCETDDNADITFFSYPSVELGPDSTLCFGYSMTLNANFPGATYLWQDGSTSATYEVDEAGDYHVTVDNNGCTTSDHVNITYIDSVANTIELLTTPYCLEEGDSVLIDAAGAWTDLYWSTGDSATSVSVFLSGNYSYELTLECQTLSGSVEVYDCAEVIPVIIDVFVPNAFTPDDDGINEYFIPSIYTTWPIDRYVFQIYNRWGEVIFETDDPYKGWMGEVHEGAFYSRDGVYVYHIEITTGVVTREFDGHVMLFR
jgi:gliding motility-associated-like protein